jgi:hypothetical protein
MVAPDSGAMVSELSPIQSVRVQARAHIEALRGLLAMAGEADRLSIVAYFETLLPLDREIIFSGERNDVRAENITPEVGAPVSRPFQLSRGPRQWPEEAPERPAAIRDEIILKIGSTGGAVSTTSVLRYLEGRGLDIQRTALATILHRMAREAKSVGNAIFLAPATRGCFSLAPDGQRRFNQLRQQVPLA